MNFNLVAGSSQRLNVFSTSFQYLNGISRLREQLGNLKQGLRRICGKGSKYSADMSLSLSKGESEGIQKLS